MSEQNRVLFREIMCLEGNGLGFIRSESTLSRFNRHRYFDGGIRTLKERQPSASSVTPGVLWVALVNNGVAVQEVWGQVGWGQSFVDIGI